MWNCCQRLAAFANRPAALGVLAVMFGKQGAGGGQGVLAERVADRDRGAQQ